MYYVRIEMPSVDWSTVPGALSRGYSCRDLHRESGKPSAPFTAEERYAQVKEELVRLKMPGASVILYDGSKELYRETMV